MKTANKIKYIPTELNYINYTNNRLKSHRQDINIASRLIIIMLLWLAGITGFLIYDNIEITPAALNVPLEYLEVE